MPKVFIHLTGEEREVSDAEALDLLRQGIASVPEKKAPSAAKKKDNEPSVSAQRTEDAPQSNEEERA